MVLALPVGLYFTQKKLAATLSFFVLAMVLYPAVQSRLYDELSIRVGQGKLPTVSDVKSLPYLNAVIKETLR